MPLTERQKLKHIENIGGSEVAACCGVSRWSSQNDIVMIKCGMVVPTEAGLAARVGTLAEPVLAQLAAEGTDDTEPLGPVTQRGTERRIKGTPCLIHGDYQVIKTKHPLETKTSGLLSPLYNADAWGDSGSDQVPDDFFLQCQIQMKAFDADVCHLAALLGGRGFRLYVIPRDDDVIEWILQCVAEVWAAVQSGVLRDDWPPPREDLLRLVEREPKTTIVIDPLILANWRSKVSEQKQYEDEADSLKRRILQDLGTAEASEYDEDTGGVTFFEQTTNRFDAKHLKIDDPELHAKYIKPTVGRVLRWKKPKVKKAKKDEDTP